MVFEANLVLNNGYFYYLDGYSGNTVSTTLGFFKSLKENVFYNNQNFIKRESSPKTVYTTIGEVQAASSMSVGVQKKVELADDQGTEPVDYKPVKGIYPCAGAYQSESEIIGTY